MKIRFHLDEHIHPGTAIGLRARGVDVTTTIDAALLSAPDEEQFAFCIQQSRVMVTNDHDFLRLASSHLGHPGIAYCHREKYGVGEHLHRRRKGDGGLFESGCGNGTASRGHYSCSRSALEGRKGDAALFRAENGESPCCCGSLGDLSNHSCGLVFVGNHLTKRYNH